MTRPTKNPTVGNDIVVGISINMMSLPCPHSCTTPITPRQFLSATLTDPANYSPARLYNAIWECHPTPPWSIRIYIVALIWRVSRYMLSGRIGVCQYSNPHSCPHSCYWVAHLKEFGGIFRQYYLTPLMSLRGCGV